MTSMDHSALAGNLVRNEDMRRRGADPLPRLLAQILERAGPFAQIDRAASRPWASALFQGRRHIVALRIAGIDAATQRARFVDGLEEAEWTLAGHFVADISVDESRSIPGEEWMELSALTIEDW